MDRSVTLKTDLCEELLEDILKRSTVINDGRGGGGAGGLASHMSFSGVCRSWRYVASQNPYKTVTPWLMLSKLDSNQEKRSFLGLDDKKIYEIKFSDDASNSWCSGSTEGWLVMTHKTSGNFLYNPINQDRINLPSHSRYVPRGVHMYYDSKTVGRCGGPYLIYPEPTLFLTKSIVVTSSSLSSSASKFASATLSNDCSRHDVVAVAAIFAMSGSIGFCRPGDRKWQVLGRRVEHPFYRSVSGRPAYVKDDNFGWERIIGDDNYPAEHRFRTANPMFADVILYRGALYAVTQHTAEVGVFEFDSTTTGTGTTPGVVMQMIQWLVTRISPRVVMPEIQWLNLEPLNLQMRCEDWNYLVESCDGELLMVVRRRGDFCKQTRNEEEGQKSIWTFRFIVFKLDESSDPMKWVRVRSLGDQILFLGINHSISVRARDIPGRARSGNCIYFTTDLTWRHLWTVEALRWPNPSRPYTCNDTGIFYLENERVELNPYSFTNVGTGDPAVRNILSTFEYPTVFITPLSQPSSFTVAHDNHNPAARGHSTSFTSSKCWRRRYTAISAISVAILVTTHRALTKVVTSIKPSQVSVISACLRSTLLAVVLFILYRGLLAYMYP